MQEQIKLVSEWLAEASTDDMVSYPTITVEQQLAQLEKHQTGIGYVYFLTPMISDVTSTEGTTTKSEELHMTFRAVFKISGLWHVIVDENMSDIATALVRMIVESIKPAELAPRLQ
jgi:hypothetical protein